MESATPIRHTQEPTFWIQNIPVHGDLILSPMAGFSDMPYRSLCREYGSAMSYTEFVSANALLHGSERSFEMLSYREEERPVAFQIFDSEGNYLRMWGKEGGEEGQLQYPYDLVLAEDGSLLVSEFGSHRIQRWDRTGRPLGTWGSHGRGEGQLFSPWALVQDSTRRIHVLDTGNHRVQVVRPRSGSAQLARVGQAN